MPFWQVVDRHACMEEQQCAIYSNCWTRSQNKRSWYTIRRETRRQPSGANRYPELRSVLAEGCLESWLPHFQPQSGSPPKGSCKRSWFSKLHVQAAAGDWQEPLDRRDQQSLYIGWQAWREHMHWQSQLRGSGGLRYFPHCRSTQWCATDLQVDEVCQRRLQQPGSAPRPCIRSCRRTIRYATICLGHQVFSNSDRNQMPSCLHRF